MASWADILERWKLAPPVAIGVAIVLLLAGLGLTAYGETTYREQKSREVGVQAEILAASVSAALVFDDAAAAGEHVNALRANPEIEAVGVFDRLGFRVASFTRAGQPPDPAPPGAAFENDRLVVSRPVQQGPERVGSVTIRALTEPVSRRLTRNGAAALLVVMASLVLAVLGAAHAAVRRANSELQQRARDLAATNRELNIQIAERERAEAALLQSQKMEAIGQLTGGVAHDFNNILMVASSGLDLIDRTTDPERRKLIRDGVRQAVDRGASLTRQLLTFSRRTALRPEVVDVARQVEGMRLLLERSLREDITVEVRMPAGLWPVEVDPSQLELALLNIAVNARDAMPSSGVIVIAAENLPGLADGRLQGDFVRIAVTDQGSGMTPEVVARVFEPFFTTKEVGKGTGLGLSQVYGFTQASGGDVRIDSAPGVGTTVSLLLPRSLKTPAAPEPEPPPAPRGEGRVLLVEDDPGVAELVGQMLGSLGYGVVHAPSAAEALNRLEAGGVDLVFSDMVMPGDMDGIDLAREIGRRRPGLPVLLTTGFSPAAAAAAKDGLPLLPKPYSIEALGQALAAARKTAST